MGIVRLASRAVVGAIDRASDVGKIVAELPKVGARAVDVSVLGKPEALDSTAAPVRGKGALGAIGKSAEWLVEPRIFENPNVGKLVGAGSLAEVLANSPSTSVVGALVMQGMPQPDALTFAAGLGEGKLLLLIGVADRTVGERVRSLLDRNGATAVAYYSGRPYGTAFHGTGPGLR
jgi:hypothetical protein